MDALRAPHERGVVGNAVRRAAEQRAASAKAAKASLVGCGSKERDVADFDFRVVSSVSPGADVARGGPSPGADVAGVGPVPVQMRQG